MRSAKKERRSRQLRNMKQNLPKLREQLSPETDFSLSKRVISAAELKSYVAQRSATSSKKKKTQPQGTRAPSGQEAKPTVVSQEPK